MMIEDDSPSCSIQKQMFKVLDSYLKLPSFTRTVIRAKVLREWMIKAGLLEILSTPSVSKTIRIQKVARLKLPDNVTEPEER